MAKNVSFAQKIAQRFIDDTKHLDKLTITRNQHVVGAFDMLLKNIQNKSLENITQLDFIYFDFSPSEAQAFINAVQSNGCPNLTVLKLGNGYARHEDNMQSLGHSNRSKSSDAALGTIAQGMSHKLFAALKEFYFYEANYSVSARGCNYAYHSMFLQVLEAGACPLLIKIDLGQNSINDKAIVPILNLLESKACPELQSFKFTTYCLDLTLFSYYFHLMINQASNNQALDLGNFKILKDSSANIEHLADTMKSGTLTQLKSLNLDNCKMGYKSAKMLFTAFESGACKKLRYLNFEGNDIGNEGAALLYSLIKKSLLPKLAKVELGGNNIDFQGLEKIYTLVQENIKALAAEQLHEAYQHILDQQIHDGEPQPQEQVAQLLDINEPLYNPASQIESESSASLAAAGGAGVHYDE